MDSKKGSLVDIIFSVDRMRGSKRKQQIQLMVEDIRESENQQNQF